MPTKNKSLNKVSKMMSKKMSKMMSKKMSKKMSMKMSSSGESASAYCVHERKPCTMVNGKKKIITMKNGNKRAMMEGMCKSCGKKVTKFVKM
jgi:hypothetical protein